VITILGPFTASFFKAYEASGSKAPLTGRIDFSAALAAMSPQFRDSGALSGMTSITVFTPELEDFVASYRAHYALVPTRRSFFVYEATLLAVDAIRQGADQQDRLQRRARHRANDAGGALPSGACEDATQSETADVADPSQAAF
jgi:hypothetical protein